MNNKLLASLVFNLGLTVLGVPGALAAEAAGTCRKSGDQIQVSGASSAERKTDCEQQGGTWASAAAQSDASSTRQSAGGGGGW
jgi:hypothetical protein